jgi:hypothetical protein
MPHSNFLIGVGLDTHRTWEAFALGTVPIVMRDALTPLYSRLPVVILHDLSELTPARVAQHYQNLTEPSAMSGYDWHRTTAFYWVQHVIKDTRRKREVAKTIMADVYQRRKK